VGRILVADDEQSMRDFLEILLGRAGHDVVCVGSGESALKRVDLEEYYDIVLTDLKMDGISGLDVLREVQSLSPGTQVIVMTAYATAETAIQAMKSGAYDYLTKPFKVDVVSVVVDKALEKSELVKENFRLRRQIQEQSRFESIVGRSGAMKFVFEMISRVASTRATVLVTGESGTGKELVAKAIHSRSELSRGPFVPINCGAIPEHLIESELFGHVRGAFTGAERDKEGLFMAAQGGTLFLDEIGELPLSMQVKLLRVLQEKRVKRVGSVREEPVDCRIVAASNRHLQEMMEAGAFRADLYYRLNVIQIDIPPLRDRREDIPPLVQHFVRKYATEYSKVLDGVSDEAMKVLLNYPYPGNVRELENIIERMVTLCPGPWLDPDGLPYHMMQRQGFNALADDMDIPEEGLDLEDMVERLERNLLLKALRRTGGVRKQAAALLGISFRSIRYRLDKYDMNQGDLSDGNDTEDDA
jgi:two-component system response regulator PilR (NtrC family)